MLYSDVVCIAMMYTKSKPSMPHLQDPLHQLPRPAASTPRPVISQLVKIPRWGKEIKYCKYNLRYKFNSNGTHYVQGKDDPLSNMWPVELCWGKIYISII